MVGAYVEHTNEEVCSLLEPTLSDSGSFVSPAISPNFSLKKKKPKRITKVFLTFRDIQKHIDMIVKIQYCKELSKYI